MNKNRAIQTVSITTVALAVFFFSCSSKTSADPSENDGCHNGTCKLVNFAEACGISWTAYQYSDCWPCEAVTGRCDSGSQGTGHLCTVTQQDQKVATTQATSLCDCAGSTLWVEASGSYSGAYVDAGRKVKTCRNPGDPIDP
jgi:hypothetical protein